MNNLKVSIRIIVVVAKYIPRYYAITCTIGLPEEKIVDPPQVFTIPVHFDFPCFPRPHLIKNCISTEKIHGYIKDINLSK